MRPYAYSTNDHLTGTHDKGNLPGGKVTKREKMVQKIKCILGKKFIRKEKDAGIKNDCDILRLKWFSQRTKADATQD